MVDPFAKSHSYAAKLEPTPFRKHNFVPVSKGKKKW
jgi:hypothetical protein